MFLFFELDIKKVKQGNKTKKNPEHPENLTVNRYEKTTYDSYDNDIVICDIMCVGIFS